MNKKPIITVLIVFLAGLMAYGQPFPEGQKFKVSLNLGTTVGSVTGGELTGTTWKPGMVIGMNYRQKLGKKGNLQVVSGLQASFRGSRFIHKKGDHYYKLNLVFAELPVDLMIPLGKTDWNITFGLSAGWLLQSEFFIKPDLIAARELRDIGFKNLNLMARSGVHKDFYYFGVSLHFETGLLDLNNNLSLDGILPDTGKGEPIKTIGLTAQVHF